ncbi:MAG: hypothetical protein KAQ79_15760, partial [Cyclobacteriaceae bacterium]|nr:hypothetical protein [Cyclobacteriaceae bacterium]
MNITVANYQDQTRGMDFNKFPTTIQKGHDFMQRAGSMYSKSDGIKKTIDLYISQLNALQAKEHVESHVSVVTIPKHEAPKAQAKSKSFVHKARGKKLIRAKAKKRATFKPKARGKKPVKAATAATAKKVGARSTKKPVTRKRTVKKKVISAPKTVKKAV